jgi:hypothetical protein
VTPNVFLGVHFSRYLMWWFPVFQVLSAIGLSWLTTMLARDDEAVERQLFRAAAGVMVALAAFATLRFATMYGEMAGAMYRRDVSAARWIQANLPHGVAMANMATSIEYLTGHRNLNLHGVTSPAFFGGRTAEREADVWEALTRLPEAERPPYLISTVATQEALASMRAITTEPPVFQTSSYSDEIVILPTHYELLGRNRRLFDPGVLAAVAGLTEVDHLNVCDTVEEAAHNYSFRSRMGDLVLNGGVRIERYPGGELVGDAGRPILGEERFILRTRPHRDLLVVMRTAPEATASVLRAIGKGQMIVSFPEAGLSVTVAEQPVARLRFNPAPGWEERIFRVPAGNVTGDRTALTLTGRYGSFYFWGFQ